MALFLDSGEIETFQDLLLRHGSSFNWKNHHVDCLMLTHLTVANSSLTTLHFLPSLSNLTHLNLSFNQINDISPLVVCTSLKALDVSHNKICDLQPLQKMSHLVILRFHHNFIETLDPIRELENLVEVWTSKNHLEIFELFNILLWRNLQHLFVYGNPLDTKPKYLEFIHALSPNLYSINGVLISTIFPGVRGHPSEFFRTVDGRLMLTQARSRLTESQKEFLLKYQHIPLKSTNSSHFEENLPTPVIPSLDIQDATTSSTKHQHNGKIRYFKAKKHSLPRKFVPQVNNQEFDNTEASFNVESAKTVVRFEDQNSAVALLLDMNGNGYARWDHNGPVACSFDGKRLFSAYRSGGIAAVMDSEGYGSIMTPDGECVLTIHCMESNLVADLFSEEDGHLLSRYIRFHSGPESKISPHHWKFQGLLITFFPDVWEMDVRLHNSVVRCKFSSLTGGVILSNSDSTLKETFHHLKSKDTKGSKDYIPLESHEDIRSGLQSIMSNLDDMLADMKKKRR